jgi:hypothetical protein
MVPIFERLPLYPLRREHWQMIDWSSYPRGRNGIALLLLRTSVVALLMFEAQDQSLFIEHSIIAIVVGMIGVGLGIGIFTSLCGVVAIVAESVLFLTGRANASVVWAVTLILCAVISMMGPGAFSMDCALFGRRRVVL